MIALVAFCLMFGAIASIFGSASALDDSPKESNDEAFLGALLFLLCLIGTIAKRKKSDDDDCSL